MSQKTIYSCCFVIVAKLDFLKLNFRITCKCHKKLTIFIHTKKKPETNYNYNTYTHTHTYIYIIKSTDQSIDLILKINSYTH